MIVHKYGLNIHNRSVIKMHNHAHVLAAAEQDGRLFIWVIEDTSEPMSDRQFLVVFTGESVNGGMLKFIDSIQMRDMRTLHVFEIL